MALATVDGEVVPVTAEELLHVPDDGLRRELVEGVVRTMAPAGAMHGRAGADLLYEVMSHVRANDLGAVFTAETGRSVTVHSRGATRVLREDDVLDGGDVLPGFTLPLSRLRG